jgi:hypothetical protein
MDALIDCLPGHTGDPNGNVSRHQQDVVEGLCVTHQPHGVGERPLQGTPPGYNIFFRKLESR